MINKIFQIEHQVTDYLIYYIYPVNFYTPYELYLFLFQLIYLQIKNKYSFI